MYKNMFDKCMVIYMALKTEIYSTILAYKNYNNGTILWKWNTEWSSKLPSSITVIISMQWMSGNKMSCDNNSQMMSSFSCIDLQAHNNCSQYRIQETWYCHSGKGFAVGHTTIITTSIYHLDNGSYVKHGLFQ